MTDVTTQTVQQKEVARVLHQLATVGGKLTADDDIVFQGTKLIIPETMTWQELRRFAGQKMEEEEREVNYSRTYEYRPWDGARATANVIRKTFGGLTQQNTKVQGLFGTEEYPPQLITISTSATKTEQVPWGTLALPHMPGLMLELGESHHQEYGVVFQLQAAGPKKYRHEVNGIFDLVELELKTNSLYRGKAFDGQPMPKFMDLSGVDPSKIVYAEETATQLEANLWGLLRYTPKMRALGIPLKRAVLLEGDFGKGKTITAQLTAVEAVNAEPEPWTFILCRAGQDDFEMVMKTAKMYQPAVIFYEDIDVLASAEQNVHRILDTFDGILAKNTQIIACVTTNRVEKIHRAMMRPGRLDAIIHLGDLDVNGTMRLIQVTIQPELLMPDIDWERVAAAFAGYAPTFIVEAANSAVRYNVVRNKGEETALTTQDLVDAADGKREQLAHMERAEIEVKHDPMSTMMSRIVEGGVEGMVLTQSGNGNYRLVKNKEGK